MEKISNNRLVLFSMVSVSFAVLTVFGFIQMGFAIDDFGRDPDISNDKNTDLISYLCQVENNYGMPEGILINLALHCSGIDINYHKDNKVGLFALSLENEYEENLLNIEYSTDKVVNRLLYYRLEGLLWEDVCERYLGER